MALRYPDRDEVRQGVQVTTTRKRDAQYIADALAQCGSTVAGQGHRWVVQLSQPEGADLPDLLTALKECLEENAIAAVKVELHGKAYTMERPRLKVADLDAECAKARLDGSADLPKRRDEKPRAPTSTRGHCSSTVRAKREGGRMSFDEAYDELVERISDRVVEKLSANRADPRPDVLD